MTLDVFMFFTCTNRQSLLSNLEKFLVEHITIITTISHYQLLVLSLISRYNYVAYGRVFPCLAALSYYFFSTILIGVANGFSTANIILYFQASAY